MKAQKNLNGKSADGKKQINDATFFFKSKIATDPGSLEVYQVCNGSNDSSKIERYGVKSPRIIRGIKFNPLLKLNEGRRRCNRDPYDIIRVGYCTAKCRIFIKVG